MDVTIKIPLAPHGKRSQNQGRKADATRKWEAACRGYIELHWPAGVTMEGRAYGIDLLIVKQRPKKMHGVSAAMGRWLWAPVKPDWDNVAKAVQDSATKALKDLLGDDCHAVMGRVVKVYGGPEDAECVVMRIHDRLPALDLPPAWLEGLMQHVPVVPDGWWESI